jgi:hypothetical protein
LTFSEYKYNVLKEDAMNTEILEREEQREIQAVLMLIASYQKFLKDSFNPDLIFHKVHQLEKAKDALRYCTTISCATHVVLEKKQSLLKEISSLGLFERLSKKKFHLKSSLKTLLEVEDMIMSAAKRLAKTEYP